MDVYEIGFIFRGFTLVNHLFKELPKVENSGTPQDLRGAFISAISVFVEQAFMNCTLEYLELENYLFVFKMTKIKSKDNIKEEPLILYGIIDKKRKPDKYVRNFLEETEPIMLLFKQRYNNKDFTNLEVFTSFKEEIKNFLD
ncbi:MAG: hypothetical protein P8Y70_09360 [Candidatus Lokiarchaeota archaeon]